MNCSYCYEENKKSSNINISRLKQILKKIYVMDAAPDIIEIFGGEPLINWRAFLIVLNYCSERKTPMSTSTNGLLLTTDRIAVLKKHNISVGISYDGRTTHDTYRRTKQNKGTEKIVRGSIIRSLENGLEIVVNMTFQCANAKYMLGDIKDLCALGVKRIKIHNINNNEFLVSEAHRICVFNQLRSFAAINKMHIALNMSLSRSRIEQHYYSDNVMKTQRRSTLGHWAAVGWD